MKPVAKFAVEGSFKLRDREIVIMGQVDAGEMSSGNYIDIGSYRLIQIKSIEFGHSNTHSFVGLRMGDAIIPEIELKKIEGQALTVFA